MNAELQEFIEAPLRRVSDLERWEAFYLLPRSPLVLNDPDEYYATRQRLLEEGKSSWLERDLG